MKKIISLWILVIMGLSVYGYTAGTTFTQQQLDNFGTVQRSDLFLDGQPPQVSHITQDRYNFVVHYPLYSVKKRIDINESVVYEVRVVDKRIKVNKIAFKACVQMYNKTHCVDNIVMPRIRKIALEQIDSELKNIQDYQTSTGEELTLADLRGSLV